MASAAAALLSKLALRDQRLGMGPLASFLVQGLCAERNACADPANASRTQLFDPALLDGTPILDIKPYLPNIDAWPDAGHGWLEPYLRAGIVPRLKKPYRPPAVRRRSEE